MAAAGTAVAVATREGDSPRSGRCDGAWVASVAGRPTALRVPSSGYYVWHVGPRWHLRSSARHAGMTFAGHIEATSLRRAHLVRGERRDRLTRAAGTLSFRLTTRAGDADGLDFTLRCGTVAFKLRTVGGALSPAQIHLGRRSVAPALAFMTVDPARSGVSGQVVHGPVCPVEGSDRACSPRPVQATVDVRRAPAGRGQPAPTEVVASTPSDAQGRFRIALAPGDYLLEARGFAGSGTPRPSRVTIEDGLFTQTAVLVDTGIRGPGGAPIRR